IASCGICAEPTTQSSARVRWAPAPRAPNDPAPLRLDPGQPRVLLGAVRGADSVLVLLSDEVDVAPRSSCVRPQCLPEGARPRPVGFVERGGWSVRANVEHEPSERLPPKAVSSSAARTGTDTCSRFRLLTRIGWAFRS